MKTLLIRLTRAGLQKVFLLSSWRGRSTAPVDHLGIDLIAGANPTNDQFLRFHIEAVVRHGRRTANRMERLVAHFAEMARCGIDKVWT